MISIELMHYHSILTIGLGERVSREASGLSRNNISSGKTLKLVLGKVWSITFKYHFLMPPYYSLLIRFLASFEVALPFYEC
ncbi:hypothetical protein HanXRQr2_Chr14g0623781 [Helianthus annuus]|uniref:Uncharacterized protein n=1 Tax=Helianthus annuus TaxID=4232 RepID=A0A9K3E6N5_HELAN|nr:hypothetical protein HanXRQr2_Chr14g0623781 [Helianthus annuus]KAJ0484295.1 hypothetical protein HanHA89_Chr14g0542561 [Helianthus annuus]KAJ0658588.1 hypothetical protein HanOQP8_Chr14g0509951 [Helianthus annuus]KAJ0838760.1 hypothetical protein HanPSC8_Chr14g0598621 [Helianthus annuus]